MISRWNLLDSISHCTDYKQQTITYGFRWLPTHFTSYVHRGAPPAKWPRCVRLPVSFSACHVCPRWFTGRASGGGGGAGSLRLGMTEPRSSEVLTGGIGLSDGLIPLIVATSSLSNSRNHEVQVELSRKTTRRVETKEDRRVAGTRSPYLSLSVRYQSEVQSFTALLFKIKCYCCSTVVPRRYCCSVVTVNNKNSVQRFSP